MNNLNELAGSLIFLSGIGQIGLALSSPLIPLLLNWKKEMCKVQLLLQQVFWTYSIYILCINLFFGCISSFITKSLIDGSILSTFLTGFIFLYWLGRLLIQFFYYDRREMPKGLIYSAGEIVLIIAFIFFSSSYGLALFINYSQIL